MIIRGATGSSALDATLSALADALEARHDLRAEELWVLGTPRAGDWARVVGWGGPVRALVVPHGFYLGELIARADKTVCFSADLPRLGAQTTTHLPVPIVDHDSPPTPPRPGTLIGEAWRRRCDRGRAPESSGLSWVVSKGSAAVAESLAGWSARRAVICHNQDRLCAPLDNGAVLIARSALEMDEVSTYLEESPAITWALGREGARTVASLPRAPEVAAAFVLGGRGGSL